MRLFIKKLSFLIFSLATSVFALEAIIFLSETDELLSVSFREENEKYAWIGKINLPSNKNLAIICGSSTLKYSLSCNKLNETSTKHFYVNTAQDAGDPIRTYFILNEIKNQPIKTVYMGLDPWIYTKYYYRHRNDIMYLDFSLKETIAFQRLTDKSTFLKRYKALLNHWLIPCKKIEFNKEIPSNLGSGCKDSKETRVDNPCDWYIPEFMWSDLQFSYLEKIISLSEINNWELVFVYPPKHPKHRRLMKETCGEIYNEWYSRVDSITNIAQTVHLENSIQDTSMFIDGIHTNSRGQSHFSKIFEDLIYNNNASVDFPGE